MFVHIGIHRPKPGKEHLLIESMHRFGDSMKGAKGLQRAHALRDKESGVLLGLAVWDSKEDWEAARPAMIEAVKDDPFEEWEDNPPEVFHLEEV